MPNDPSSADDANRSGNPDIQAVSDPARRVWLHGGLAALASGALLQGCTSMPAMPSMAWLPSLPRLPGRADALLGFKGIAPDSADRVVVPTGYQAQVIAPWGEPVGLWGNMPAWRADAGNSASEQAAQLGMHHDGLHFYPLTHVGAEAGGDAPRGLLVINHEYTDDGLLHADGLLPWTAEKVRKAQAAHGVSVIEVALSAQGWQLVRPSRYARRHTAYSAFAVAGPAAGHALLRTADDPGGRSVLGTLANCGAGRTPWGTFLSGEENFAHYFAGGAQPDPHQLRWGLRSTALHRWAEHDRRFDAARHPNEFNRFGWVVEIDPMDPTATPVKRTALGRGAHEGAWVAMTQDQRAVVYWGEDARFEYLYKFVSRDRIQPAAPGVSMAQANRTLLDTGTLHVARFETAGVGRWLPLVHGQGPLTRANGFADQGEVLVKTRQASDLLGATRMDRPEWIAIDAATREVYCALTNNADRGQPGTPSQPGQPGTPSQPGVDGANPRANNVMGQIIRWKEDADFDSPTMRWSHLLLAGDPGNSRSEARGNIKGDYFGCPDGLMIDARGILWIQTDVAPAQLNQGEMKRIGNNQMLACDRATGEVRRFLSGPRGCEITGAAMTPDGCTLFVNVQHPGEIAGERGDPAAPSALSNWPDFEPGGRPRSATLAIRRIDGGLVGS